MDNKTVIETFNVLAQLDNQQGMPIKFTYALCRIHNNMKPIVKILQTVKNERLNGQNDYDKDKTKLLVKLAEKDDHGRPVTKQTPNGIEYVIEDHSTLHAELEVLNEDYKDLFEAIDKKQSDFEELMEIDAVGFSPYLFDVKYLPTNPNGTSRLTPQQLRCLLPFLEGDIENLPSDESAGNK